MQGVRRRGPDENLAEWVVEITSTAHKAHSDMFVEGYARYCPLEAGAEAAHD